MKLKYRGGYIGSDGATQHLPDNIGLVVSVSNQDDAASVHDVANTESNTAERNIVGSGGLAADTLLESTVHKRGASRAVKR